MERKRPNSQTKYRQNQADKGLVRYELQVSIENKKQFEALVEAAADELPAPWSLRQRMAKARTRLFDELTKNVRHEFFALKEQITALRAEVKALSPSFFKSSDKKTPLPEAIQSLPDDPKELKHYLATLYTESQQSKIQSMEWKRRAQQYEKLYDTQYEENERLKKKLNIENEVPFE